MKGNDRCVPRFSLRFLVKGHHPHGDAVQDFGFVHLNKQIMDSDESFYSDEFTLHTFRSFPRGSYFKKARRWSGSSSTG